ncbi:hypothetical protein, partial [Streptomyces gramineus]|uniref:hypothetical protein n=1 Tax=Streptomyces gramineus TaxID=910542 RepID=UPI00398AED10
MTSDHRGLTHRGMTGQDALDLTRLDPETTHLHLLIDTTHVLQIPIGVHPHQVTRAIHPTTRLTTVGIRDEPLRRHTSPVQIPPG